ncbi:MAG: archaeal heat shock protein Hsp20 [Candidatus Bathyarchaeia archaeon]|nr:Hsp20/alpha crystallin family protein [Candidatus Bathyarchaeota archaeon]
MSLDDWFRRFWRRRTFFFPDIERMVEDMEREISEMFKEMERAIPPDMVREFQLPDGTVRREYGPFVYGYSMKIGPDGRPIIREFGNIKPSLGVEGRPPLNLQEQREPLVDVIDEAERVRVIAELPGVEKEDINLYATARMLTISVDTPQRKYYKELELPVEVDEFSAKSTYKNGILEVIFNKKKERKKGTPIKIE